MTKIIEVNTFNWEESDLGKSEGSTYIQVENDVGNLYDLVSEIENAYSYKTYDISEVPQVLSERFNQGATYKCSVGEAPSIAPNTINNVSATTFLNNDKEELIAAADCKRDMKRQLEMAVLDSQKRIILSCIDYIDENKVEWVFSPAGSTIHAFVLPTDRIISNGQQIWPKQAPAIKSELKT